MIEHLTPVDKSLYILINGMMTVRCDGFFLQAIQPNEFINSVEWKCHQYGQTFSTHQVKTNLYEYLDTYEYRISEDSFCGNYSLMEVGLTVILKYFNIKE